jgi:hypothetical protein
MYAPVFLNRYYIAINEEDEAEEREIEPEPEPKTPPQHFAHCSTGAGYEAGAESWGMPHDDHFGGTPWGGDLESTWGQLVILFLVTQRMR